jgi:hypothetical protein
MALAFGTLAVLIILVLLWRRRTPGGAVSADSATAPPATTAHHAVYVKYDTRYCCWAVRALGTKKFLSAEAPPLPLAECDRKRQCSCVYRHLQDRRASPGRRATDHGFGERPYLGPERRSGRDRRLQAPEAEAAVGFPEPRDYFLR